MCCAEFVLKSFAEVGVEWQVPTIRLACYVERMVHPGRMLSVELLWIASESNRRFVPALFSADGRMMDLDRTSASTVRASIEGAAIEH